MSTCNEIFKTFVKGFSNLYYHRFTRIPISNSDELLRTMEIYRKLGFPGCFGSMDVTHVRWHRCPSVLKHDHQGKEGYPSLAFQVVVNHSRLISHISPAFMGAYNDLTISRNDKVSADIMSGQILSDTPFALFHGNELRSHHGLYVLTDNGYPKCGGLIPPEQVSSSYESILWSEFAESVRKDVECLFGILKARLRIFRNPISYADPEDINNAFKTAGILHNILMIHDNLEYEYNTIDAWESLDWNNHITLVEDDVAATDFAVTGDVNMNEIIRNYDTMSRDLDFGPFDFYNKRECLIKHFTENYRRGFLMWPKNMTETSKRLLNRAMNSLPQER
jgi:hypothetical protein